jgi:hypothetical protein
MRSMFNHAERCGLRANGTNSCNFTRQNKHRKCERFLPQEEIARLGTVLERRCRTQPHQAIIVYL